jgi:nucleoside-diphosphate-sugar epimerase
MKVFLAGASGAIGQRIIPQLVRRGHRVIAATRTTSKMDVLRAAGAEPVLVDGLDRSSVMKAVVPARPDAIIHQMTALTGLRSLKNFDHAFVLTNRLRTEGTEYLLQAAREAGARKFIAQSYAGWPNVREGGRVKSEEDRLDPNPPGTMIRTLDAIRQLEAMVTGTSGIAGTVLRYGSFYGPGTSIGPGGDIVELVRQRKFPIFGDGGGVWSFIHIDDAAAATVLALEGELPGTYNIVDDEPAEVRVWLPDLAQAIGAKLPYHLPVWLGRLLIGEAGISVMTKVRGSSNAKAKRDLAWQPVYATWRDGFRRGFREDALHSLKKVG